MSSDTGDKPINYDEASKLLEHLFSLAEVEFEQGNLPAVNSEFADAVGVLFKSKTQSFREVALGCGLVRLLAPNANLRLPYANQGPRAYNGRTLDEKCVNPFLHDRQMPASKGPYLATFRRSVKFDKSTRDGLRDEEGYDSFLRVLEGFEATDGRDEIESYLKCILIQFAKLRNDSRVSLARIRRISLDQYRLLFEALLQTSSGGQLPVLLVVAMFKTIADCFKLPWMVEWQGINVADRASGAGGDVSIVQGGELLFSIEITERVIDLARVVSTFNTKIRPQGITDYLFMFEDQSPDFRARQAAARYFNQGHEMNFVEIKPWLVNNLATVGANCRAMFAKHFLDLLDTLEVPATLKVKWNDSVKRLFD